VPDQANPLRLDVIAGLTGFKAGIGLVIVLDQVPKLLGVHLVKQGFFIDLLTLVHRVPETSLMTLAGALPRRGSSACIRRGLPPSA